MRVFQCLLIIFLLWLRISIADENIAKSVEVNVDGKVSNINNDKNNDNPTSLDAEDDINESIERKLELLQTQILELQNYVKKQQDIINDLNSTLVRFVFTADEYGIIYDKSDDRPLLLTSSHSHSVPFVMLNVISVRLPKRDAFNKKNRKQRGRALGSEKRKRYQKKTRFMHVIITLSRNGIYQLWDEEQNELYTYFDSNISIHSIHSNTNFIVYSDIVTQQKYGNTWFVMARNDSNFVKMYTVAAWRDHIDQIIDNKIIKKSIVSGQISPENVIYRPSDHELNKIKQEIKEKQKQKKKIYRMSAAKRHKMGKNKNKNKDINEFDIDDNAENKQCDENDKECIAKKTDNPENDEKQKQKTEEITEETEKGKEGETEKEKEEEEEEEIEIEIKNATVTGVAVYQQQKKQYVVVSYSDGKVFSFKPNGQLSSTSSSIPYQSPNKTIIAMSTTRKKYTMMIVTEAGFQFLKLPKLTKTGPFCQLPPETIISAIEFDQTQTTLMYLGTNDGRLIIYNTKKLNRKMCQSLDSFTINPDSPLQIETLPGYLLITSSLGLHVYNVTKRRSGPYQRPGLIFVRKFEEEFGSNDDRLSGSNVLISSYTDGHERTIIAYAQSAHNVSVIDSDKDSEDVSYKFVVMESYLPSFTDKQERGGIMGIISKAPIFVGIAMFAFFWVFFKGKSGGGSFGNSPLGRLGKIFGGGRKRGSLNRSGGRDIHGVKDRWTSKHGIGGSRSKQSANMRYSQNQAQKGRNYSGRSSGGGRGGFGSSGKTYRKSGGFGGDWSD